MTQCVMKYYAPSLHSTLILLYLQVYFNSLINYHEYILLNSFSMYSCQTVNKLNFCNFYSRDISY